MPHSIEPKTPDIPIACSLGPDDVTDRIDEWRRVLATAVTGVRRPDPQRLELRLDPAPEGIATTVDLARREKACCQFFDFRLEIGSEEIDLIVTVPTDASSVLDGFESLAPDR
jgi:hypothetical protein